MYLLTIVIMILSGGLGGCSGNEGQPTPPDPEGSERTPYSTTDLAELAQEAVVYIEASRAGIPQSMGSGFIIDPDGVLITNYHVLEGADGAVIDLGG